MVRRRGWWAWLVVVVLGLTVVGCSKPVPTEAEIVGTWVGESPDGWGEPGGTMVFNADGTFTAAGVPEGLLDASKNTSPMSGEGTWTIRDGSGGNSLGSVGPGVRIEYSPSSHATRVSVLVFTKSRGTLSLTVWKDYDLPERYIFVKQD